MRKDNQLVQLDVGMSDKNFKAAVIKCKNQLHILLKQIKNKVSAKKYKL